MIRKYDDPARAVAILRRVSVTFDEAAAELIEARRPSSRADWQAVLEAALEVVATPSPAFVVNLDDRR